MDKETIIKKLTQPLVYIVAIAVAVGTGVAYGCINHVRNEKQELVSKADISVYREATSDELKILRTEDLTQAPTAPILEESQENLLQTVRDYFTARYNFNGSYSDNEEEIIIRELPFKTANPRIGRRRKCPSTFRPDSTDWLIYIPFDQCDYRLGGSLLAEATGSRSALSSVARSTHSTRPSSLKHA